MATAADGSTAASASLVNRGGGAGPLAAPSGGTGVQLTPESPATAAVRGAQAAGAAAGAAAAAANGKHTAPPVNGFAPLLTASVSGRQHPERCRICNLGPISVPLSSLVKVPGNPNCGPKACRRGLQAAL